MNKNEWTPPYSVRSARRETGKDTWSVQDVEVLDERQNVVGAYSYNYSSGLPFCPFEIDGQWYALYSKDYTASRIMRLPSCDDVWGEDRNSFGFCPVEFYVPAVQNVSFGGDRTGKFSGTYRTDFKDFEQPHFNEKHNWTVEPVKYMDFAFVCGCVWGDDSSWKIRFFDLSRLASGEVTYDERFGYIEMHRKLNLRESVEIIWPGSSRDKIGIRLFTGQDFNFDGTAPWTSASD